MVSVLKMLLHLQALCWEPELCQCDFVRCLTFGITVKICPDLSFEVPQVGILKRKLTMTVLTEGFSSL